MSLKYGIILSSDMGSINFNEIKQTSQDTCRKSLTSPEMCLIKWDGAGPSAIFGSPAIVSLQEVEGRTVHTNSQIRGILSGSDWTSPEPI